MLSGFPDFTPEKADGRYSVIYAGQKITIYSDRSASRDLAQLQAAIEESPAGHTLILVAPYADSLAGLFSLKNNFIFIAPVNFSQQKPDDSRFVGDDATAEYFVNQITEDEKFTVFVLPQWQAAHAAVSHGTKKILERAAIRLKTIQHFAALWQINFRLNAPPGKAYGDLQRLREIKPDALVMAGPSLDRHFPELQGCRTVWCADTALPAVIRKGVFPQVVFSVDAGFASREHFVGVTGAIRDKAMVLVCDLLGNPSVQRLPFAEILTYAPSHPLTQQFSAEHRPDLTALENPAGDVGSLMRAAYKKLFGSAPVKTFGHDGRHDRHITHARGTAYFSRSYFRQNRLSGAETYMFSLSRRYT